MAPKIGLEDKIVGAGKDLFEFKQYDESSLAIRIRPKRRGWETMIVGCVDPGLFLALSGILVKEIKSVVVELQRIVLILNVYVSNVHQLEIP